MKTLIISGSPHAHTENTVEGAMWGVVLALMPALLCSFYYFGLGALTVTLTAVVSCVAVEYLIQRYLMKGEATIANGSAVITGLLLAFNVPSNLPLWIMVIGAIVAIGIGKMSFGGLGQNIFNPALVGRVFLLISFPSQMTTWPLPLVNRTAISDATTGATILSQLKYGMADNVNYMDLFLGNMGGSLGEVSALALILGGCYMLYKRIITWHIPVAVIGSVALMSLWVGADPLVQVLSGGVMLGAIFMATDYVSSPMTYKGMLLYGVMIGVITVIIRRWGAYPEGMSFAILIMNGFTPLINKYLKPIKFGGRSAK